MDLLIPLYRTLRGSPGLFAQALDIHDSGEVFYSDTAASAGADLALLTALTTNSASVIAELTGSFGVDLSLVSRLGGHSVARTHRDKSSAPGGAITSALMKRLTALAAADDACVEIVKSVRVVKLLEAAWWASSTTLPAASPSLTGTLSWPLADFAPGGFLAQHRPVLLVLATTNADHVTGDGARLAAALAQPAGLFDLD
ncbi:hypothetical protein C8R44DRAFT_882492 [Mycena epipterygia]|nr:hypothetical protein C8R44DRAFT_882492 [Mycena epipterygia]